MKALSIRQPWAWLVVNGWKNVENRERRFAHRGPMLIHAASWMTDTDYEACRIFVDGICDDLAMPAPADLPRGGIVGEVVVLDCVSAHPSPWFTGPWGLVLDEALQCDLVPWRGMPGLFDVPIAPVKEAPKEPPRGVQRCRVCDCTDADCSQCVARTGRPCHWVEDDLCSACRDGWNGVIRVKRGNTTIASVRIGRKTLRASTTGNEEWGCPTRRGKSARGCPRIHRPH
jgi:hypothetical protein